MTAKIRCRWRENLREWNRLEERYGFYCRNQESRCYPGLCIEDWRCTRVVCELYIPVNLSNSDLGR